jgi:hypothetical protein
MTRPLGSSPITGPLSLLRGSPPLSGASVLSASRWEPLAPFPLPSPARFSRSVPKPGRIANDSEFGLSAGIWSRDIGRIHRVAARLDGGRIVVNEYGGGFVQTPCGGFKHSGYGREQGIDALGHYTQLKSVIIRL